jgi:hypothetical protein
MEQIIDARLRAFKPDNPSQEFKTITDGLVSVSAVETAQDAIDSATFEIESTDDILQGDRITSGDGLVFEVQLADGFLSRRLTAIARDVRDEITAGGGVRRTSVEATDFVFSILGFRNSDAAFENEDVGNVVDALVAADCPEIRRSQIQTVGEDITLSVNGRKTLDVITQDLQPAADAVMAQDGADLIFKSLGDVTPEFELQINDLHTPINIQRVDDELRNRVRIDGGTDAALDAEQPNQSATVRVTNSSRRIFQVPTRKSELDSIEIFTVKDDTANEGIVVRLQAARNGSAVNPNDRESDVARRELAPEFISDSGFTEFGLPDHDLAPAENPFIIVEGVGSTGHQLQTNGSTVSFRAFFPFPLLARASDGDSVSEFRRRDLRRRDEQLDSEQAVRDAADAALNNRTVPKRRINATAATPRAHQLRPSDAVDVSRFPVSDVSGTFIVTERRTEFDGTILNTELTLEDATTI